MVQKRGQGSDALLNSNLIHFPVMEMTYPTGNMKICADCLCEQEYEG